MPLTVHWCQTTCHEADQLIMHSGRHCWAFSLPFTVQSVPLYILCTMQYLVVPKGVGPGMTLAWPGWKQSVIAVEVDTGRLETSRFKKCYANCVLLYFPSTFNVYWHGGGAAGLSCTELSIWEFPFLRGVCWQGWTSIWYCEKGMPQKDTLDNLRTPVCFRILSSSLTSVSIFSVCWYSSVLYLNGADVHWHPLQVHTLGRSDSTFLRGGEEVFSFI